MAGRSFIDPEIETRVEEVRSRDAQDPLALLEPHEQQVARLLAQGRNRLPHQQRLHRSRTRHRNQQHQSEQQAPSITAQVGQQTQ